jgi:hypothetical protein
MPVLSPFDYAILRVVPHVEREEFVNVGVVLFCRPRRFLGARIELKPERLLVLCPDLDLDQVQAQLDLVPRVVAGGEAAGPLGDLNQAERFHWLVAPRSTILQVSPVHPGLCDDPQAALDDLFERLIS